MKIPSPCNACRFGPKGEFPRLEAVNPTIWLAAKSRSDGEARIVMLK